MIDYYRNYSNPECLCLFWETGKATYSPTMNTLHNPDCPIHPLIEIMPCICKTLRFKTTDALNNEIIYTKVDNSECLIHNGDTELIQVKDDKITWVEKDGKYWRAKP